MLWWIFAKFLMSFLKAQVSFPSNVTSIISVIKQNCSIRFWLKYYVYTLFKGSPLKCKFLWFSSAQVKICHIPHVNFQLTSLFLFKFWIICHCHDIFSFRQKYSIKAPIWRISSAVVKISPIPHVNFWKHNPSNFVSILSAVKRNSLKLFWLKHYIIWSKAALESVNFWDFRVLGSKIVKFLMLILKWQVNFSSDFSSFFSVITYNSSGVHEFSTLNKRIPRKYQFWHFQVFWWKFAKFVMSFSKPQVSFSSNFA